MWDYAGGFMAAAIEERVIAVIAKTQKLSPESICPDSTFEQLGIDSLSGIELVFELEEAFGVEIPDAEARRLRSVREAVEALSRLVEPGREPA
jgi:Acyl carrier protein